MNNRQSKDLLEWIKIKVILQKEVPVHLQMKEFS